jgi:hypothetical protein
MVYDRVAVRIRGDGTRRKIMPRCTFILPLFLLLALAAGCGDDDDQGPAPEQITGEWLATKVEYVSSPPGTTVDIVVAGGTGTLELNANGEFHLVVTPAGEAARTTDGAWTLNGDVLRLTPAGMPFSWEYDVSLASGNLSLRGAAVEWDFDGDGTNEQATSNMGFVRDAS